VSRFELADRGGGRIDGWAPGFERRRLRALRRGEPAPGLEVDLHGLRREEARRALRGALQRAREAGIRCVLVVHGRGARSEQGPVLREALPEWLAEAPHGDAVLAFSAADDRQGGATYVLLRRAPRADRERA
jgi:DNA-nicking Smr family endonuclease